MSDFWLEPGQLGYCVWDSVSYLNLFLWLHLVGESGDHHFNTSFLRYKSRFHTEPLLGLMVVGVPPYCCAGGSSGFWLGGRSRKALGSADAVGQGWWGALGCYQLVASTGRVPCMASLHPSLGRMELCWFFGVVCLEWDNYCIAVSISWGYPCPDLLVREGRICWSLLLCLLTFLGHPPSSTQSGVCKAKRKSRPLPADHPLHRGFCLLPSAFKSLQMTVLYVMSRTFCVLSGGIGKSAFPSFQKQSS